MRVLSALASALLAFAASTIASAAPPAAPAATPAAAPAALRFLGPAEKVTLTEAGRSSTLYRVTPGRSVRIGTSGAMSLLVTARPFVDAAATPVTLGIVVTDAAGVATTRTESLPPDAATRVAIPGGAVAAGPRVIRVPIAAASATVELRVDAGSGALVSFARTGYLPPVTASAARPEPALDDSVLEAIPMIRKAVERLSIGPRAGVVIPARGDLAFGGLANVYAGAEVRFTPPQLERRLSLCLEAALYEVRDRDAIVGAEPIGSSAAGDVRTATRVVPVMAGLRYRLPIADSLGLHAAAGGGAAFLRHTERVGFRDDRATSNATGAAYVRVGADRKIGRGRALSLDVSWIHPLDASRGYGGGLVTGVHYRLLY